MSIATLKRKSDLKNRSSARSTPQQWVSHATRTCPSGWGEENISNADVISSGYSINGGSRAIRGVQSRGGMSTISTPYRGNKARGHGGHLGKYVEAPPIWEAGPTLIELRANQAKVVAPSICSSSSYLRRRTRAMTSGSYPCSTTQEIFTGNQTDATSSSSYTEKLAAKYNRDKLPCPGEVINYAEEYADCSSSSGGEKATTYCQSSRVSGRPGNYVKTVNQAMSSSERTKRARRTCGQAGYAKQPYPGPVNTSAGCIDPAGCGQGGC